MFASEAALIAAFPDAEPGDYALVDTGGDDAQLYVWDETDSAWVASGVTTIIPDASETVKGISEEATQAQVNAGTAIGETGARLFVNPEKLAAFMAANTSQFLTEHFAGNGVTTVFTIPEALPIKILSVFVGGQRLRDGTHYTKDETAKTVTISPAVITGVGIDVEYITGLASITALAHWDESTWGWHVLQPLPRSWRALMIPKA